MAFVQMTKDFSQVKKTLPGMSIMLRQIFAGAAALVTGVPVFIAVKFMVHADVTIAALCMAAAAIPFAAAILYKPNLWKMKKEHKAAVIDALEKIYGETSAVLFEDRVKEIAGRIARSDAGGASRVARGNTLTAYQKTPRKDSQMRQSVDIMS